MGGHYLPGNISQSLAVLSAFISSVNIAGMNVRGFLPRTASSTRVIFKFLLAL